MIGIAGGSVGVGGSAVSGSQASYAIRYPSSLAVGQLIVLVLTENNVTAGAGGRRVLPGFTEAAYQAYGGSAGTYWQQVLWKRATSSDVAARGVISTGAAAEVYGCTTFNPGSYDPSQPILLTDFQPGTDYAQDALVSLGPETVPPGGMLFSWAAMLPSGAAPGAWSPSSNIATNRYLSLTGSTSTSGSIAMGWSAVYEDSPYTAGYASWQAHMAGTLPAGKFWESAGGTFMLKDPVGMAHQRAPRVLVGWMTTRKRSAAVQPIPADYSAIGGQNVTPQKSPQIPVTVQSTTGPVPVALWIQGVRSYSGSYSTSYNKTVVSAPLSTGTALLTLPSDVPLGVPLQLQAYTQPTGGVTSDDDTYTPALVYTFGAPVDAIAETITANVGGSAGDSHITGETITANVTTGTPTPHLWFAYRSTGVPGDTVTLYGRGLGASASAFHSLLKASYGASSTALLPIVSWTTRTASAAGLTDARRIDPGVSSLSRPVAPIADPEVDVVQITVPPAIFGPAPATVQFYASGDGGVSNLLPWSAPASNPAVLVLAPRTLAGSTAARALAIPTGPGGIPQRNAAFLLDYVVEGGEPQGQPLYRASARSQVAMGALTTGAPSGTIPRPGGSRFLPSPAALVPAPDLGTTASRWVASERIAAGSWVVDSSSSPYVEQGYVSSSRTGPRPETAMVFDGSAYATYETQWTGGFSLYFVAQIHAELNAGGQMLPLVQFFNKASGTGVMTSLVLWGGYLRIVTFQGATPLNPPAGQTPIYRKLNVPLTSQPLLIGWVQGSHGGTRLYVGDTTLTTQKTLSYDASNGGATNSVRLCRGAAVGAGIFNGSMDILDMVFNPGVPDVEADSQATLSAMDGIHGVVRR